MSEDTTTFEITIPEIKLPSAEEVGKKFKEGYADIIGKVDEEIAATPVDISTKKGRQTLISLSAKISKTKVALDKRGKELVEPQKKLTKTVDEERKVMREALDKRRDEVRAPVTAWEDKEKTRKAKSDTAFEFLYSWKSYELNGKPISEMTSEEISGFLKGVEDCLPADPETFGEDIEDYEELVGKTVSEIKERIESVKAKEKDAEELAKLRAEREEREAKERRDAEEKQEADRLAAQKERLAVEAKEKADLEAKEAVEAERRKVEEAEALAAKAERDRLQQEESAKTYARQAAAKAEAEKQEAVEAERQRQEQEKLAAAEEERRRAADLKLRKGTHSEIVEDLVEFASISEAQADRIIQAIDDCKIRNIKITY